jgi:hypothetical protein
LARASGRAISAAWLKRLRSNRQGRRDDSLDVRQQIGSGAGDPAREQARKIGAVGVLELEDQVAGVLVVEASGARMVEGRPAALAGRAACAGTKIVVERRAAAIAERRLDKHDPSPSLGG